MQLPTDLYPICQLGKGQLFMMPKPSADQLATDIAYYADQSVNKIVSLLLPEEVERLGLSSQADVCAQHKIEYQNFPIKDMDVPDMDALHAFLEPLKQEMASGVSISFHCHGGRGRAGTAAISLMLMFGIELQQALKQAREGRKDPMVPVCDVQNAFLVEFSNKYS